MSVARSGEEDTMRIMEDLFNRPTLASPARNGHRAPAILKEQEIQWTFGEHG